VRILTRVYTKAKAKANPKARARINPKAKAKSKASHKPHDKRHKELFSNKESFISFLNDCVKLPWVKDIDKDSLTKTNASFILQDFSEKEADVVYEAKINGKTVIFYILMELQSKVDYSMPYRLFLYIMEILRYYYNNADVDERDNKDFKFPVVFPIVFYSGPGTWTVPLNFCEMFSDYEIFDKYVPNFEYMLINAKGYDDETLKTFSSKLLGLILKLEKSKNDVEFFNSIKDNLDAVGSFDSEEKRILNFCIKLMDTAYGYNKSEDIKQLLDENQTQEVEKMLCDIIENAKAERAELHSQGHSQGRLEGRLENAIEVVKNMLRRGRSTIQEIAEDTGLELSKVMELQMEFQTSAI